jgi:hypothetical protein
MATERSSFLFLVLAINMRRSAWFMVGGIIVQTDVHCHCYKDRKINSRIDPLMGFVQSKCCKNWQKLIHHLLDCGRSCNDEY